MKFLTGSCFRFSVTHCLWYMCHSTVMWNCMSPAFPCVPFCFSTHIFPLYMNSLNIYILINYNEVNASFHICLPTKVLKFPYHNFSRSETCFWPTYSTHAFFLAFLISKLEHIQIWYIFLLHYTFLWLKCNCFFFWLNPFKVCPQLSIILILITLSLLLQYIMMVQ